MVRIAISVEAIAQTLPLGSVGYEKATNERGKRLIWLEPNVVDRLRAMRGYSDARAPARTVDDNADPR